MLSTIIEGGNQVNRTDYINNLKTAITTQLGPDPTSIGIKAVQELVLTLSISSANPRLVWIQEAQTLTSEASNALLKVLEEPPSNTTIYLTCPNSSALLPTIRSRCQIVSLSTINYKPSTIYLPSLKPLFALSPGDRLQHLSDFPSDKTELLKYFQTLAYEISDTIKKTKNNTGQTLLSKLARLTLTAHQDLSSNVNQTLVLSHYLLHLPKTK
jgi:DNA polymerase III delta prime subunit